MESILESVKKSLGILDEYEHFDPEIIQDINTAFFTLNQLGIGPKQPFTIKDNYAVWTDFLPEGKIEAVKSYIPLQVKLLFDPPSNSFLVESIKNEMAKFEFRMMVEAERYYLPEYDMSGVYISE